MENKTHWKKLNNPDYIGAYELLGRVEELKVKIKEVKKTEVTGADGKKEQCTVAYLYDHKPLILNSTNCKTITSIYDTPFIEDWKDIDIILVVKKIKAFGDIVDALRVKPVKPLLPELKKDSKEWGNVKKAILNGYTIEQIKTKYQVSKQNEKLLTDEG